MFKLKTLVNTINKRNFFTVINQAEVAYRELLGKNRIRLNPGLRLNLPLLHSIRRVNMREDFVQIPDLDAYTKDNVPVTVSGSVFYKPVDVEKICFSINHPKDAVNSVGSSSFRAVIGRFDYDEIIAKRNEINAEMLSILGRTTLDWGIETTRLEIQNFGPQNKHVATQLEKQMQAERSRRENELETLAKIKTAEGEKQTAILKSEGQLISAKNESEAIKYELSAVSNGFAEQIKIIAETLGGNKEEAVKFLLEMKRLEHLKELAKTNNNVYFIPPENMFASSKPIVDLVNKTK